MSADPIQRERYAVIGNPVAHSKSPYIHAQFAAATGEPVEYDRLLAPLDGFVEHVRAFRAAGGRGLNVTVPFKLEAHALANRLSPRAAAAGAVNTLRFDEDGIFGDNTDGFGLVRDIEVNLGVSLKGARVLLLGAGGAARGVVLPMLERQPAEITIVNRTAQKAHALIEQFEGAARESGCHLDAPCAPDLAGIAAAKAGYSRQCAGKALESQSLYRRASRASSSKI